MIVILMGVSGSGKTTIGEALARRHGCAFVDADDHHPPANVAKMSRGEPLTDDDRWPWLDKLNALLQEASDADRLTVLACSALRQAHRDRLARGLPRDRLHWVFLRASEPVLRQRMADRRGHFMPASLLRSQFQTLEAPTAASVVDADRSVDAVVDAVERAVGLPSQA